MAEPRKRKSAADRRAEIVETAIRLSARMGPDRVTTQHLADEVGVTQPAIFRHFATKGDIWLAVGDHIVDQMEDLHRDGAGDHGGDPHGTLQRVVGHHFVHISDRPAIPAILYSHELQAENAALREKFTTVLDRRRKSFAGLIRAAQAMGVHRADLVAEDAARLVSEAMHGLSMRWLLDGCEDNLADTGPRVLGPLIDGFRA
ncbi:MAG: TetR/AcrR family transcriptional regulator [Maritimibacter sp.]|nr:TetR/AcrR family transcriptional regulator [Maritimibacter sp.]